MYSPRQRKNQCPKKLQSSNNSSPHPNIVCNSSCQGKNCMLLSNWNIIEPFIQGIGIVSISTFFISIVMIPWLIGHLPHDYFVKPHTPRQLLPQSARFFSIILFILKNIAGFLLFLAGIAMLFLPGQGILTIILGIALMSFPGKRRLLFAMTAKPSIRRSLNWLRTKTGHQKFIWPT